jgi:hypothetical protein
MEKKGEKKKETRGYDCSSDYNVDGAGRPGFIAVVGHYEN